MVDNFVVAIVVVVVRESDYGPINDPTTCESAGATGGHSPRDPNGRSRTHDGRSVLNH